MAKGFVNVARASGMSRAEVKMTLLKDGWKNNEYVIDLSSHGLTGDETFLVGTALEADEIAKEEFAYAIIEGKAQSAAGITLSCQTAPIEDIPIVITIFGKGLAGGSASNAFAITFMNGSQLWEKAYVSAGQSVIATRGNPTKPDSDQSSFVFKGWSSQDGSSTGEEGVLDNIQSAKTVYAAFKEEARELPVEESPFPDTLNKKWAEIIADGQAGNTSGYKVGDIKNLRLSDGGFICFELAGINVDELAEGGKAPFTFVAKTIDGKSDWSYSSRTSYTESDYRTHIEKTCAAHMPSQIAEAAREVKKYARAGDGSDVSYQAKFWPPSAREMGFESYEKQGPIYSLYSDASKRLRPDASGSNQNCWLSSCSTNPVYLGWNGLAGSDLDGTFSFGALPCFCL